MPSPTAQATEGTSVESAANSVEDSRAPTRGRIGSAIRAITNEKSPHSGAISSAMRPSRRKAGVSLPAARSPDAMPRMMIVEVCTPQLPPIAPIIGMNARMAVAASLFRCGLASMITAAEMVIIRNAGSNH